MLIEESLVSGQKDLCIDPFRVVVFAKQFLETFDPFRQCHYLRVGRFQLSLEPPDP